LIPTDGKLNNRESKVRVKALFDYNPDNDPYIPCKEAGLEFKKGEVLHIVSQVSMIYQYLKSTVIK
jgi:MAGUK p55 subfamily member 3/7